MRYSERIQVPNAFWFHLVQFWWVFKYIYLKNILQDLGLWILARLLEELLSGTRLSPSSSLILSLLGFCLFFNYIRVNRNSTWPFCDKALYHSSLPGSQRLLCRANNRQHSCRVVIHETVCTSHAPKPHKAPNESCSE